MHTVTRISCGSGNCFFVEENGNALLIDTCRAEHIETILRVCADKNIRLIALTHGHVDHVQNAAALSRALGAPIAMHEADYNLSKNNLEEPMFATNIVGKYVLAAMKKSFGQEKIEPFEPQVFLKEGDKLDSFGITATVLELPGHTRGSLGILVGDDDLFVGDALMNLYFPSKSLLYGDRANMLRSVERISGFTGVTIHFGHGKSLKNRRW